MWIPYRRSFVENPEFSFDEQAFALAIFPAGQQADTPAPPLPVDNYLDRSAETIVVGAASRLFEVSSKFGLVFAIGAAQPLTPVDFRLAVRSREVHAMTPNGGMGRRLPSIRSPCYIGNRAPYPSRLYTAWHLCYS